MCFKDGGGHSTQYTQEKGTLVTYRYTLGVLLFVAKNFSWQVQAVSEVSKIAVIPSKLKIADPPPTAVIPSTYEKVTHSLKNGRL